MPTASIRIDEHALATLRELANKQRLSLQTVSKEAIDSYRRQKSLEEANTAFAALHDNPEAWREEEEERELWDRAIKDGLERA